MFVDKDGAVRGSQIEFLVPDRVLRAAQSGGHPYRLEGFISEIADLFGVQLADVEHVRITPDPGSNLTRLVFGSSWKRPSRR